MRMQDALERVLAERVLEPVTADQYERTVRRFEEHLGRPATVADLTYESVNAWLIDLSQELGPITVSNYRRAILMLWNYLAAIGEVQPYAKQRVRKPKAEPQIVESWTLEQLKQLIEAAKQLPGQLRIGIPVNKLLVAWLWVGFDTGLRPIDLRLLQWKRVHLHNQCVTVVQHKTKYLHTASLSEESIEALREILEPSRDKVFPLSKGGMRRWELRLFAFAKQSGFCRRTGQGLGRLRSLHATEIYRAEGLSAAAESLGHVGGTRTVRAHYIDARAVHMGRLPRRPYGQRDQGERGKSRAG